MTCWASPSMGESDHGPRLRSIVVPLLSQWKFHETTFPSADVIKFLLYRFVAHLEMAI